MWITRRDCAPARREAEGKEKNRKLKIRPFYYPILLLCYAETPFSPLPNPRNRNRNGDGNKIETEGQKKNFEGYRRWVRGEMEDKRRKKDETRWGGGGEEDEEDEKKRWSGKKWDRENKGEGKRCDSWGFPLFPSYFVFMFCFLIKHLHTNQNSKLH